jgi:hypothetical protein
LGCKQHLPGAVLVRWQSAASKVRFSQNAPQLSILALWRYILAFY